MKRRYLPVHWANREWIEDRYGIIRSTVRITKRHPKYINYKIPPFIDTTVLRERPPDSLYRARFTDQFIDEKICSSGHCIADIKKQPICFLTSGGTASGKTASVQKYLDEKQDDLHYLRIDYDALKRCLPEFNLMMDLKIKEAAEFVQHESAKIAGKLFKKALSRRMNIIREDTLAHPLHFEEDIKRLRKKGYLIVVIATHVTPEVGRQRADARFRAGGRYIKPEVISDIYRTVPVTLKRIKDLVDVIVLRDNNGPSLRTMVQYETGSVKILDLDLYNRYIEVVGTASDLR